LADSVRADERCGGDSGSVSEEEQENVKANIGYRQATFEEVLEGRTGGLMRAEKQRRLEKAGWRVGDATDFLGLDDVESKLLDIKIALAKLLRSTRARRRLTQFELAERIGSSQSRVAKLEAGDPTVSVDLLVRSLIAAGAKPNELAKAVAGLQK
jgi:DNA-binding XRE family transcriptional regulator